MRALLITGKKETGSSATSSRHCCVTRGHVGDWDLNTGPQLLAHFSLPRGETLKLSLSLSYIVKIFRNNKQVGSYVLFCTQHL